MPEWLLQVLLAVAAFSSIIQVVLNRKMDRHRTQRDEMKAEILGKIDNFETRNSARMDHLDECVDHVRERVSAVEGQLRERAISEVRIERALRDRGA